LPQHARAFSICSNVEVGVLATKGIAIERGVETEQIARSEALALHAAACNGMPDPVFHLVERAIGIVSALAAVEPDPRAGESDMLLDTALRAATALAQLLQARHGFATAETHAQRDATTAALINAGQGAAASAEEIDAFFKLAEASWAAGRRGRDDLN
jgi:hypothetical protein